MPQSAVVRGLPGSGDPTTAGEPPRSNRCGIAAADPILPSGTPAARARSKSGLTDGLSGKTPADVCADGSIAVTEALVCARQRARRNSHCTPTARGREFNLLPMAPKRRRRSESGGVVRRERAMACEAAWVRSSRAAQAAQARSSRAARVPSSRAAAWAQSLQAARQVLPAERAGSCRDSWDSA